jgi:hypothetical protein
MPVHVCGQVPTNDFPLQHFLDGALKNLDLWTRTGAPPPRASPIALDNPATYSESMVTDRYGNPVGGVRSPYVGVPRSTYVWYNDGPGCGSAGHVVSLPQSTLQSMYPTYLHYVGRVIHATFDLVEQGWVPRMDGRKIILQATRGGDAVR